MITVTNRKTNATESGIYVGRPSSLGNPFLLIRDGDRDQVISLYRIYLKKVISNREHNPRAHDEFFRLLDLVRKGQPLELVCWCVPLPCHAEVIKEELEKQIEIKVEESYNNYLSHSWKSAISDFETGERTAECVNCGCEDSGDPREFDWLEYPHCERTDQ